MGSHPRLRRQLVMTTTDELAAVREVVLQVVGIQATRDNGFALLDAEIFDHDRKPKEQTLDATPRCVSKEVEFCTLLHLDTLIMIPAPLPKPRKDVHDFRCFRSNNLRGYDANVNGRYYFRHFSDILTAGCKDVQRKQRCWSASLTLSMMDSVCPWISVAPSSSAASSTEAEATASPTAASAPSATSSSASSAAAALLAMLSN
mmetsp:Transcript_39330/g.80622  ORF Transcript_39330/g.80622 Transcript_39330/m.80622 type:complete len:203 (+) Transcript_39330:134-742(+)